MKIYQTIEICWEVADDLDLEQNFGISLGNNFKLTKIVFPDNTSLKVEEVQAEYLEHQTLSVEKLEDI